MTVVESISGQLVDVNASWLKLFGHTREKVLGTTAVQVTFWRDMTDRDRLYSMVAANEEFSGFEAWLVRTQSVDPLLCWVSGRRFELDGKQFYIFSWEDITAQREAEKALRNFNAALEERVEDRTKALQDALSELGLVIDRLQRTQDELVRSEKLAALGSLVAGIAHELNTPIGNCVMVASHLLASQRQLAGKVPTASLSPPVARFHEDVCDAADILMRNLHKAAELVSSFKRVAVDQTSSQRREFMLDEVVAELALTMGAVIRHAQCTVEQGVPPGIRMDSYPGALGQIITNLLNNAIIHGFDGKGGVLRISATNPNENGLITLIVADNGRGIPAHVVPRIFDPFFTTKRGAGGSGLGLNIVHNMVEGVLGGRIVVESAEGQGARFVLTLPLIAPQPTSNQGTPTTPNWDVV